MQLDNMAIHKSLFSGRHPTLKLSKATRITIDTTTNWQINTTKVLLVVLMVGDADVLLPPTEAEDSGGGADPSSSSGEMSYPSKSVLSLADLTFAIVAAAQLSSSSLSSSSLAQISSKSVSCIPSSMADTKVAIF